MILNVVHVLLLQRSFAAAIPERQLVVRLIAVLRKVVVVSHVGHVSYLFISGLEFTSRFLWFYLSLIGKRKIISQNFAFSFWLLFATFARSLAHTTEPRGLIRRHALRTNFYHTHRGARNWEQPANRIKHAERRENDFQRENWVGNFAQDEDGKKCCKISFFANKLSRAHSTKD